MDGSRTPAGRPRARALGIGFDGRPGPANSLVDVPGVEVGLVTLIEGDGPLTPGAGPVRTGVTAILPRGRDGVPHSCAAGWFSLNGNGEMTGTAWLEETGSLRAPVLITNTHAVGPVHRGAIDWMCRVHPDLARLWMLPVVAETWDGYLNDTNGDHVSAAVAAQALDAASSQPFEEGSVGGGTGMNCYAFKGGTGTASRLVRFDGRDHVVGVLVQANFGSREELTVAGVPVGRLLEVENPMQTTSWLAPPGAGSVIVVVATDLPLLPGQCKALARRVPLGLARTGTAGGHFSGDLFLAFSTANPGALDSDPPHPRAGVDPTVPDPASQLAFVPWGRMDAAFTAVVQCVEEAVVNALVVNDTMIGRDGHRSPALPHEPLLALLAKGLPAR